MYIFENLSYYIRNPIIRVIVDKFLALTFQILLFFQVDLYPKDPDQPRIPAYNRVINISVIE